MNGKIIPEYQVKFKETTVKLIPLYLYQYW